MRLFRFAAFTALILAVGAVQRQGLLDFIPKGPGRPPSFSSIIPGSSVTTPSRPPAPAPAPVPAPAPAPVPAPEPAPEPALAPAPAPVEDDDDDDDQITSEQEIIDEEEQQQQPPPAPPAPAPEPAPTAPAPAPAPAPADVASGNGQGYFPCHPTKGLTNDDVSCSTVQIPSMLCERCPLRPVTSSGQFQRCDNIFDIDANTCKDAMREYVDLNTCDHVRANAVQDWLNNDFDAAKVVDYFLYSVCELCCDCVPMGVSRGDYAQLSNTHSDNNPTLWDSERGNCPAHAQYDLCNVLPHVTSLTSPGGATQSRPKACPSLRAWLNSDRSTNWQSDPDTSLDGDTNVFLNGALSALGCDRASVWNQCYDMESRQNHLAIPGGSVPEPPSETFAENEEVLEEVTASSPGSQQANDSEAIDSNTAFSDDEDVDGEGVEKKDGKANGDSGKKENESSESEEDEPSDVEENVDPEASPESTDSCFPATALVELENGSHKSMQDLLIGDRVRVSATQFSEVFMFSHRDRDVSDVYYIRIRSAEASVTMTAGHYLQVQPTAREESTTFMMAENVKVGDKIQTSRGHWTPVVEVSRVSSQGLYNPHTREGTIVVDGILASTYTRSVGSSTAHALLAPMRALDFVGLATERYLGAFLVYGVDEKLASLVNMVIV